jgi:hypothetical protein
MIQEKSSICTDGELSADAAIGFDKPCFNEFLNRSHITHAQNKVP